MMSEKHISAFGYIITWLVLLALTAISFGVNHIDLGPTLDTVISLTIATAKAIVVVMVFMHLLEAKFAHRLVALVSVLFVVLLVSLTAADVATRRPVPTPPETETAATASQRVR